MNPLRSLVRTFLLPVGVLTLCQLGACSAPDGATPSDGGDDPLTVLEHDTGVPWTVRWHPDVRTPAFLEGHTPPLAATPKDAMRAGRAFLLHYRELFKLTASDDDVATDGADTDELGMTHARFQQKRGSVPVWGADLIAHFAPDGALVRVNGRVLPVPELSLAPTQSPDQARVAATLDARTARPEVDAAAFATLAPTLVVLPLDAGEYRLAWRVEVEVSDLERPGRAEVFVDAGDGSVLARQNLIDTLEGSGVGVFGDKKALEIAFKRNAYWLEDATRGGLKTYALAVGKTNLPGTEVHSSTSDHFDEMGSAAGSAVDAHAYLGRTWDYYLSVHGRSGWDGKGTGPHVTVHFGDAYDNAFFDGNQLVFGDGDGISFSPLAGALDVVAHEYTHGITAHTAKLGHANQPGALNEAISDIFACFVTYGSGRGSDWQVGETVYHPSGRGRALRDLAHPHASGNPATMDEYQDGADDSGGVHINSTIVSHAAWVMTEGDGRVKPLGHALAERIWYRALTRYLTSRASFRDAADATLSAAHDLGMGEDSVRAAWVAVGVM
jgi:Zn-dependent metalloprotease